MTYDPTEEIRRAMVETGQPHEDLAANTDRTWTIEQVRDEFELLGFLAPYIIVRRKRDGVKGSLEFTHSPRIYFGWRADA